MLCPEATAAEGAGAVPATDRPHRRLAKEAAAEAEEAADAATA